MADENGDGLRSVSGLPEELGIDEDLARSEQRASVRVESRRYDKPVTVIEGLDPSSVNLAELASELKRALAVGGTVEDGRIELQGTHADRAPELLRERGFEVE
ncbi:MAG: stress response translation initiation inhibitor YciH [Euryarchaeota archaeon]|nr:stress response translation initiation inhibitor YciH [Euryarchaeota archaeon]